MAKLNISRTVTTPQFAATRLREASFYVLTKPNQILEYINVPCHYLPWGRCPLLHPVCQAKEQGSAIRVQISTTKDQAQGQLTRERHTREMARVLLLNVFKSREEKGSRQHNREWFCPGRRWNR